jgi:primosomal protein N'
VFRLNNYFRFQIQVQSPSPKVLHEVLREVLATVKTPSRVEMQIDIDPYQML